jgi:hypothetical protein
MPLGLVHAGPLKDDPTLGPTKRPVVDTAVAFSPPIVTNGTPVTKAVNWVMVTDSTYTVCPLRGVRVPVKPFSKNPSFTVGSLPT